MPITALLALAATTQGYTAIVLDPATVTGSISPYIYGVNAPDWNGIGKNLTMWRFGGNRVTAYNWETNASNAGTDYFNENDSFLGGGSTPTGAIMQNLTPAFNAGAAAVVAVPMDGYVSADENGGGDVNQTPDYIDVRFNKSYSTKGSAFTSTPDLTDHKVFQDEFVWNLERNYPSPHPPLWYELDNEPDLWFYTHPRITPVQPTYASLLAQSQEYAQAIKRVKPDTLVFGPVSYGWNGYENLQNATDANGRNFLAFYLQQFQALQTSTGKRYLDVLDLHWYPEATGNGVRITNQGTDPALYDARVQAPRSLWDPTYTEVSWITQYSTNGPIQLLPRMQQLIADNYPGTKLAITEWNYGGGDNITGSVADADVLGVFGKYGLFAALYWNLLGDERYAFGGFAMYRNFNGRGGVFGDQELSVTNPATDRISVYASRLSTDPHLITMVLINKSFYPSRLSVSLKGVTKVNAEEAYRLAAGSPQPRRLVPPPGITSGGLVANLPGMTVTTVQFRTS